MSIQTVTAHNVSNSGVSTVFYLSDKFILFSKQIDFKTESLKWERHLIRPHQTKTSNEYERHETIFLSKLKYLKLFF